MSDSPVVTVDDVDLTRDELSALSRKSDTLRYDPGRRAWIDEEAGAVIREATPEGVPDDYEYLPPDEEPPEGHDVVESPAGGTYVSREPVEGGDDSDGTDADGETMSVDEAVDYIFENTGMRTDPYSNESDAAVDLVRQGEVEAEVAAEALLTLSEVPSDDLNVNGQNVAGRVVNSITGAINAVSELPYKTSGRDLAREDAIEEFNEEYPEQVTRVVDEAVNEWQLGMFERETAPVFQLAAEQTGNETLPEGGRFGDEDYIDDVLEMPVSYEDKQAIRAKQEQTQELLREAFGDEITVFRGQSTSDANPSAADPSDAPKRMKEAAKDGDTVEHEHRPAESWTTDPGYASYYSNPARDRNGQGDSEGVLMKTTIPVEDVVMSAHAAELSPSESEVIVAHDETEEYDPDQLIPEDEVTNKRLVEEALSVVEDLDPDDVEQEAEGDVVRIDAEDVDPEWLHRDPGEAADEYDPVEEKAGTPEGVPDDYEYLPPGEDPPEGHDVVESDAGGTYVSREPVEETDDDSAGDSEQALEEYEENLTGLLNSSNRSDVGRGPNTEEGEALWSATTDALDAGADPEDVAGAIGERFDETEGYNSFYSTDEVLNRYAQQHYEDDDPAARELAERLHDYAEHPDEYPDVPERDEDPFAGGDSELRGSLTEGVNSDNLYEHYHARYDAGQEAFGELEEAVEGGVDPAAAVLAYKGAYDDVTLEDNDRGDLSGKGYDFMYGDHGDTEAAEELQKELRKFHRDPEDYPRDLSDDRRAVMDELEKIVEAEQDDRMGANTVDDLSWFDLRNNDVDEAVGDMVANGADPSEVTAAIDENIDGDNRGMFYRQAAEAVGSRNTSRGEADYLSSSQSAARQAARDEWNGDLTTDDEERQWNTARTEWFGDVYTDDTAPLFQLAVEQTGNEQLPDDVHPVLDEASEGAEEHRDMYAEASDHTTEVLRDVYGDTMTCYRGLSPEGQPSASGSSDISRQIEDAAESGESAELNHRTLESWSANPLHARKFAGAGDEETDGVVVKREVDVERAVASSYSGQLIAAEDEVVVAHDERDDYEPEQVITAEELRSGDDAAELLRRARNFADDATEREAWTSKTHTAAKDEKTPVSVTIEDLPPVNWLQQIDTDDDESDDADDVTSQATPEGVPENYEYVAPDEEPREGHDVVDSQRGATYESPEPVDDSDDGGGTSEREPGEPIDLSDASVDEIADTVEPGDLANFDVSDVGRIAGDERVGRVQFVDRDWVEFRDGNGDEWTIGTENVEFTTPPEEATGGATPDELADMSTSERLRDAFDHAQQRKGFREAGGEGGNTTGDEMEILEYQDGTRDFAIPVDAYNRATTGVVDSAAEARKNNLLSPMVINALGGRAAKVELTEDPETDEEYLVKEGLEGATAKEYGRGDTDFDVDEDALAESAKKTMAAAYFVGNADLHGGNLFIDEENDEYAIIDHDSAGEDRYSGMLGINRFTATAGMTVDPIEIRKQIYDNALAIRSGEVDPEVNMTEHGRYMNDAADKATRAAYVDDDYELDEGEAPAELQFPPMGYEDMGEIPDPNDDPAEFVDANIVDSTGEIVDGQIEDVVEDPETGEKQVRFGYEGIGFTMVSDLNRFTEIND